MTTDTPPPNPPSNPVEQLHWLREEERHEISWIDHRLQWMLLSQSFLMTAAITAQSNEYPWWCGAVVTFILGFLGSWLALRGGLAIRAAQAVIQAWLRREQELCAAANNKTVLRHFRLNRPMHQGEPLTNDSLHSVAVKLHEWMHPVFVTAWLLLFLSACAVGLHQKAINPQTVSNAPIIFQVSPVTLFLATALTALIAAVALFYFRMGPDFQAVERGAKQLEPILRATAETPTPPEEGSNERQPNG